jgi:hypothetical protein
MQTSSNSEIKVASQELDDNDDITAAVKLEVHSRKSYADALLITLSGNGNLLLKPH